MAAPDRAKDPKRTFNHPLDALRYHVSGAVERGEKEPIVEVPVSKSPKGKKDK
jgi:hypothetical protein